MAKVVALAPTRSGSRAVGWSRLVINLGSFDGDDLVAGIARHHFDPGVGDVEHLLEPHSVIVELAMLSLEGECHAGMDFNRVIE